MLKKVLCILICLMLICSVCFAEVDFNVDDYTEDELIDIMCKIREANSNIGYLYANDEIVVGKDIPAGLYEFWIEEDDIGLSKKMIDENLNYHCQNTLLCMIAWGSSNGGKDYDDVGYYEFYYDEYNNHKMVTLKEGQVLATIAVSGVSYRGARMKYIPDGQSGLFSK